MDAHLAHASERGLADAESVAQEARSALDRAQAATRAAESIFHQRRAEEADRAETYRHATDRVRELYAVERRRLEEAKRAAEEELHTLDAKLRTLAIDEPTEPAPGEAPVVALAPAADDDAADDADTSHESSDASAYEEDWYRSLRQRAQADTGAADSSGTE